jgi:hypothetical protein
MHQFAGDGETHGSQGRRASSSLRVSGTRLCQAAARRTEPLKRWMGGLESAQVAGCGAFLDRAREQGLLEFDVQWALVQGEEVCVDLESDFRRER